VEADVGRLATLVMAAIVTLAAGRADAQARWDLAGTAGLFTSHVDESTERGFPDDWSNAAHGGIVLGRYLSRHLKLELEAATTSRGLRHGATAISLPGVPYPYWLYTEVRTSVHSLIGVMVWQFRENEWVHPFVLAGISSDWDDSKIDVPQQFYYGDPRGPSVPIATARHERTIDQHLRGVFGAGAKLYFTERAFVRADGRLSWSSDRQHATLRAGIGIDF
jgi:hypothetical protein